MKRNHLSLAIGMTLLLGAVQAQAQEAAKADEPAAAGSAVTLDAIQVTARRREETLQDVPVAVTAFTPEALDKLNIRDIGDLDAQVPNLTIYSARGSNSTITAYIRGVGQSDPLWGVDPGVGLYLDDVYIARPQGGILDVFDVGRIEVLRGPQGTLYGKNTIGGAIKYISKDLTEDVEGFVSLTAGNYNQFDFKAAVGGEMAEGLRGRIAVASLNRDGFGENLVTGDDVSDKDTTAVRGTLGIYPTENFDIKLTWDHLSDKSGVRGAAMLTPNRFSAAFPTFGTFPVLGDRYDVRNGMPNVNQTDMTGGSVTATWRANDDWTFKSISGWRKSDTETNIDFDTTTAPIADVKAFYNDEQWSQELQASYDGGGRSRGVMGLYWFDGDAGGQVLNNFFNASFGDTQGRIYTQSIAAYADFTFDLSERWTLDVGARWTDEDKRAVVLNRCYSSATFLVLRNCSATNLTPIAAQFDKTINFSNVSPKVSVDYQVNDDVMLYALATRGFKSGGYNIRAQATAVPRSAEPFQDEEVTSFEIGSKMSLLDSRLFLNLAYFHNDYKDVQLSVFTSYDSNGDGTLDAFFGDFTNAGAGTVTGFEVEYQWLPTQNWLISGNLAWLDAKYDEFIFTGINIANEQEFTNAPDFSAAINVEYRTELSGGGNLSARVGYSYQSDVVATTEINRSIPVGRAGPITQEGYGLLNAGVIWKTTTPWTLSLQASNLTDKEYLTTGYSLDAALGVHTGFYGAPRQIALTARYDF